MEKKKLFIPNGKLGETRLPGSWGGVLTPSKNGKGWDYEERTGPKTEGTEVRGVMLGAGASKASNPKPQAASTEPGTRTRTRRQSKLFVG